MIRLSAKCHLDKSVCFFHPGCKCKSHSICPNFSFGCVKLLNHMLVQCPLQKLFSIAATHCGVASLVTVSNTFHRKFKRWVCLKTVEPIPFSWIITTPTSHQPRGENPIFHIPENPSDDRHDFSEMFEIDFLINFPYSDPHFPHSFPYPGANHGAGIFTYMTGSFLG